MTNDIRDRLQDTACAVEVSLPPRRRTDAMKQPRMYFGRAECGCVVAATMNNPNRREEVADFVRQMIIDGLAVESAENLPSFDHLESCPNKEDGAAPPGGK